MTFTILANYTINLTTTSTKTTPHTTYYLNPILSIQDTFHEECLLLTLQKWIIHQNTDLIHSFPASPYNDALLALAQSDISSPFPNPWTSHISFCLGGCMNIDLNCLPRVDN
jgi:hypothetical protein